MRYVVVCVVDGEAGRFNNSLRSELWSKLKVRSSKLPAHFTIKAPFEYEGKINELEHVLEMFCKREKAESFRLEGYDCFDKRVIYMKVKMSDEGKAVHDRLIDEMMKVPYLSFTKQDGKDKVFHVTVTSKRLEPIYDRVWEEVEKYPCDFECSFDNICIYEWKEDTWKLYRKFMLQQ